MQRPFVQRLFATTLLVLAMLASSRVARAGDGIDAMVGPGIERLPSWQGARTHRNVWVPYLQIELPDGITLSSADGLTVDLLHDSQWRVGPYANYQWGRDREDLGAQLGGIVDALPPRPNVGGYLEYQVNAPLNVGSTLSHDTDGAGIYLNVYADCDLPRIGGYEQSLQLQWQAMNGAAMRRFFGVRAEQAARLGIAPWRPGASSQEVSLEYDAFMPTSRHTGFVLGLNYARLLGDAAHSPLVRRYGTANQFTTTLAFVYRYGGKS